MMNIILKDDEKHCRAVVFIKHLHMCISKCSGSCMVILKEKILDSKESLAELNNILDKLSACDSSGGSGESIFMNEVTVLKMEAAKILETINLEEKNSVKIKNDTVYNLANIFEESSFKERLNNLRQNILSLSDNKLA